MTDQERQPKPTPTPAQSGTEPKTSAPNSPSASPAQPGNVITEPTQLLSELQKSFAEQLRLNLLGGIGSVIQVSQETALDRLLAGMGLAIDEYFKSLSKHLSDAALLSVPGSLVPLLDESSLGALRDYYAEIQKLVDEARQRWEPRAPELQPYFEESDFCLAPSMNASVLERLFYCYEHGQLDEASLKQVILEEYGRDHCDLLKFAVESWLDDDIFSARMPIINDALQAHIDGMFTLSVPALLPQIEGIVWEILGICAQRRIQEKAEQAVKDKYRPLWGIAEKEAFRQHLGALFAYIDFKDYRQDSRLNRHAILHGVQLNYATVENSLRAFLILDSLSLCIDR